jgi:trk system potassium uptake protein TrkA
LHGNPFDEGVLEIADIQSSNVVISMTPDDQTNILSCLLAKKLGARRVAAVLNDMTYSALLHSLGINSILDARSASISKILHYIRKGGTEDIVTLEDGEIEIFAIEVSATSHIIGITVSTVVSKNEVNVAAIIREDNVYMLPKKMLISTGDKVLLIVRKGSIGRILKMFQEKPKYLA